MNTGRRGFLGLLLACVGAPALRGRATPLPEGPLNKTLVLRMGRQIGKSTLLSGDKQFTFWPISCREWSDRIHCLGAAPTKLEGCAPPTGPA